MLVASRIDPMYWPLGLDLTHQAWYPKGDLSPGDREGTNAVDGARRQGEVLGRRGQLKPREPAEQSRKADLEFRAGQGLADALVQSVAEGQMTARVAPDVQLVGVGEDGRIAVGGLQGHDHAFP